MRLKDAPAACEAKDHEIFMTALKSNRGKCIRLVELHEHQTPDTFWRTGDPQGRPPRSEKDKARMRLVATVSYKNGQPVFPPANTRLSDELVYLATKFLRAAVRGKDYPYDFLPNGDIRPERVPSGVGPIVWAHGLPHFPVYKGYYILCGRKHAKWIGWLLNVPNWLTKKKFPVWTIGAVVAPASALGIPRAIERQLRVHKPSGTKDVEKGSEKYVGSYDVVQKAHYDHSVIPRNSSGGYHVGPIYQIPGYQIRVGPDWADGRSADIVDHEMFLANGLEALDYNEALKKPYVNEKSPQAEKDGLHAIDEEADEAENGLENIIEHEDEESTEAGDYLDYTNAEDSDYEYEETVEDDDLTDNSEGGKSVSNHNPLCRPTLEDANKYGKDIAMSGHLVAAKKVVKTSKPKVARANKSKTIPQPFKITKQVAKAKGTASRTMEASKAPEITLGVDNLANLPDSKSIQAGNVLKTEPQQSTKQSIIKNMDYNRAEAVSSGTLKTLTEEEIRRGATRLAQIAYEAIRNKDKDTNTNNDKNTNKDTAPRAPAELELELDEILEKATAFSNLVKAAIKDLQEENK